MGVPTSEVGYISAMPRREDHLSPQGHVGALGEMMIMIMMMIKTTIITITKNFIKG